MACSWKILLMFIVNLLLLLLVEPKKIDSKSLIEVITDAKEFKKLLRTKTNVLVLFAKSTKDAGSLIKLFGDVADETKGYATLAYIECGGDGRKLCKKLKVVPDPAIFKHYKDGEFHKDYDRKLVVQSMVNFLKDPSGDAPWEEDDNAQDVVHIQDAAGLKRLLQREKSSIMIMFYAPWCGFCKRLKPEYAAAATELKGHSIIAAMDVNKPENSNIRRHFNITGFPTLLYFENGMLKYKYEGENNKDGIVAFMKNPTPQPQKPKEPEWADVPSEVVHLTDQTFEVTLQKEASVLIMFYAPWCGHCKKMKPEYVDAAAKLKQQNVPGILGAVDATKEKALAERFNISGYPSVKYFKNGEFAFDVNLRTADKIIEFMKDPKEPPPPPPPEVPWHETPSDVVHLTEENFKVLLKRKKHALVMFYAPWCGHCKKAKPEFQAAASVFKDDPKVMFAAIDCTAYSAVCSAHDVKGYPTLTYFNYYKTSKPYSGGRTESDFVSFMMEFAPQEPLAPPTTEAPVVPETATVKEVPPSPEPSVTSEATTAKPPVLSEAITTPSPLVKETTTVSMKTQTSSSATTKPPAQTPETAKAQKATVASETSSTTKPPVVKDSIPTPEASWTGIPGSQHVKQLSLANIKNFLSSIKSCLVLFCGRSEHCQKLRPIFAQAAETMHKNKVDGVLAAVDVTTEEKLAAEYKIGDTPEFQYFRNGKLHSKYGRETTVEHIVNLMMNPPVPKDEL